MREHTHKLLEKAERSIRAARILAGSEEAEFAAGRAYYAMFYVAEALLYERNKAFGKHSAVHAAYGKEFAKTGLIDPKYHRWLLKAFEDRLQTDDGVDASMSSEDIEMVMERAQEFSLPPEVSLKDRSDRPPSAAPRRLLAEPRR